MKKYFGHDSSSKRLSFNLPWFKAIATLKDYLHPAGQPEHDPVLAVHRHGVYQPGPQALVELGAMFLQLPKEFFLFTEYMCILLVIIFFSYDNVYVICIFIFFPSVLSFTHP